MEMPEAWMKSYISSHLVMIGLDRAFIALYSQTRNPQYLSFMITKLKVKEWDMDIVLGRQEKFEEHIFAYLTRCIAQLEFYRLKPDGQLLHSTTKALAFLKEVKIKASLSSPVDIMIAPINGQYGNLNAAKVCRLGKVIQPKVIIASHFWMFLQHAGVGVLGDPATFLKESVQLPENIAPMVMAVGEMFLYRG